MQTKFIEAMHPDGKGNWGKFLCGRFTPEEWQRKSVVAPAFGSLLNQVGWTPKHLFVMDLQTGEGAFFMPGGLASYDLNKHKVWVCPMFEPFLTWLYDQDLSDLDALPDKVEFDFTEAEFAMHGYRRPGPEEEDDL